MIWCLTPFNACLSRVLEVAEVPLLGLAMNLFTRFAQPVSGEFLAETKSSFSASEDRTTVGALHLTAAEAKGSDPVTSLIGLFPRLTYDQSDEGTGT